MALHVLCVSRASSLRAQAAAWTPATMRGARGLPPLGTSSANGRQPSPRRRSPSAPGSLAGAPETAAGNGSSPARNGSPLAGKRVIDNSNAAGHVPRHARQLCRGPGDGGRRPVPRWPEIGSRGGRKSGPAPAGYRVINNSNTSGHVPRNARQLRRGPGRGGRRRVPRWPEIGSSIPGIYRAIGFPHFFPRSSNRAQHPNTRGRPMGTMPPGPTPDQAGGTPLKSNKCH